MTRHLLWVALVASCVDRGPGPQGKKVDVSAHIVRAVPADITKFETRLGDSIVYVGNKIDQTRVAPGGTVNITHYWRVDKPIGASWRVFGLVRGPANTADFMNLVATDMQQAYPPAKWRAGELIEDTQQLVLRPDWRSQTATVLVGLIEVGKHGTLDRMPATGPQSQDGAVIAATLAVDLSRAPPKKGTVYVSRAKGAIAVDGIGTDPGWSGIVQSPEFVTAEGGADPNGKATARMTWDDQYLYVFVNVTDSDIFSPFKKHDDTVWKADCVELFIDADGNQRGYIELQVNPNNTTFDSWFATTRAQPGDVSWDSGMVTAVKVAGTPDKSGDGDTGWEVEIGIPWSAVRGRDSEMKVHLPPQVGDRWRLNVVRVDKRGSDIKQNGTASTWNRISISDFHALNRMLDVVFADSTGSIAPGAVDPALAPAAPKAPDPNVRVTLATDDQKGVVIEVRATGDVIVASKPTADASLDGVLQALAKDDAHVTVTIKGSKDVAYGKVIAVADRVRAAGLTELAFAVPKDAVSKGAKPKPTKPVAGVAVELPQAKLLVVTIDSNGAVSISGQPVPDAALDATLRAAAARAPQIAAVIAADQRLAHAAVVKIMDRVHAAGIVEQSLVVRTK